MTEEAKVYIHHGYGNPWHYGHFIHDFLIPVTLLLERNNLHGIVKHIYILNTDDQSIGTFRPFAERFLDLQITELREKVFREKDIPLYSLTSYDFGPYPKFIFPMLVKQAQKTLSIQYSPYKVILIERGLSVLRNNCINTGVNRRFLINHQDIRQKLERRYKNEFKNVILERLSPDEQISLFMNAEIVIAQHGAGLCNIVWMTNPNSLVLEIEPIHAPTFVNICKAQEFRHINTINEKSNGNDILMLIDSQQRKLMKNP